MEISEEQIAYFFLIVAIIAAGYLIYSLLRSDDNIKEIIASHLEQLHNLRVRIHVLEDHVENIIQTNKQDFTEIPIPRYVIVETEYDEGPNVRTDKKIYDRKTNLYLTMEQNVELLNKKGE
jgi:hypothetical protein